MVFLQRLMNENKESRTRTLVLTTTNQASTLGPSIYYQETSIFCDGGLIWVVRGEG